MPPAPGRVLFAAVGWRLPRAVTYHVLPFVLVGTFLFAGVLTRLHAAAGIAVSELAGLGCSALLPLTISFGEKGLTAIAAAMAGGVIAFYQFGYGIPRSASARCRAPGQVRPVPRALPAGRHRILRDRGANHPAWEEAPGAWRPHDSSCGRK